MDATATILERLAARLEQGPVPLLLGADDAAAFTGLTRAALYRATSSGAIGVVDTAGGRKWRRKDLEQWIDNMKPARTASKRGGYRPARGAVPN